MTQITYMPKGGVYIEGHHESMPQNARVLARRQHIPPTKEGERATSRLIPVAPGIRQAANYIAANKERIRTGQLTAADSGLESIESNAGTYSTGRDNIDPLVLIRLHDRLMGEQERWFHLDEMFNKMQINQLVYRMSFKDNIANSQEVGPREEYDITKVPYANVDFFLTKIVTAYDIAIEDKYISTLDPVAPLQASNDYALAYRRELRAKAALEEMGVHYNRGTKKFTTTESSAAAAKLPNPSDLKSGSVHSEEKFANAVQAMKNEYLQRYDSHITHIACSPKTAMDMAQNTWTEPNTIFNVEAYRTDGGVRPFPGVANTTLVIAQILDDNKLYCINKPSNVLTLAEGPKISRSWQDNNKFTEVSAHLDFNQYKNCQPQLTAAEDFNRVFGFIAEIDTTESQ